jgi:hypothetical protein
MNTYTKAIMRVCFKRLKRGASKESILGYLRHLRIEIWKNCPGIVTFIETLEDKFNKLSFIKAREN